MQLKNEFLTDIALIWTILGTILSGTGAYLTLRGLRRKISFAVRSYVLVREYAEAIRGLKITLDDKPIPDLTVVNIAVWNSGFKAILPSDLVGSKELSVEFPNNTSILQRTVAHKSRETGFDVPEVDASLRPSNALPFKFVHMGHKDGMVVQLLVTGPEGRNVQLGGKIVDGVFKRRRPIQTNAYDLVPIYMALFSLGGSVYLGLKGGNWSTFDITDPLQFISLTLFLLLLSFLFYMLRRVRILPKGFSSFYEIPLVGKLATNKK